MLISLDLAKSIGFEVNAATTPAAKLAIVCVTNPFPKLGATSKIVFLLLSYTAICEAVTIIARFTVGPEPLQSANTPSSFATLNIAFKPFV